MLHEPGAVLVGSRLAAHELAAAFAQAGYMPVVALQADHAREFASRQLFELIVTVSDLDCEARLLRELGHADALRVFFGDLHGPLPPEVHAVMSATLPADELVARVGALPALHSGPRSDGMLRFGPLELDLPRRTALWRGELRSLTPIQFRILMVLVEKQGAIATREELQRAAWRWTPAHDGERLIAHIRRIRAKLEDDPSHPRFLLTARGEGFRLADVDADGREPWNGVERRRGERRHSSRGFEREQDSA